MWVTKDRKGGVSMSETPRVLVLMIVQVIVQVKRDFGERGWVYFGWVGG